MLRPGLRCQTGPKVPVRSIKYLGEARAGATPSPPPTTSWSASNQATCGPGDFSETAI